MTVEPIQAGALAAVTASPTVAPNAGATNAQAFSQLVEGGLSELGTRLEAADGSLRAYAAGEPVAVHDLVIAMEQARVSLQFAVEVRNRVVEAYQELMRMQV